LLVLRRFLKTCKICNESVLARLESTEIVVSVFDRGSTLHPAGGTDTTLDPLVGWGGDTLRILYPIDTFGVSVSAPQFLPPLYQILYKAVE